MTSETINLISLWYVLMKKNFLCTTIYGYLIVLIDVSKDCLTVFPPAKGRFLLHSSGGVKNAFNPGRGQTPTIVMSVDSWLSYEQKRRVVFPVALDRSSVEGDLCKWGNRRL